MTYHAHLTQVNDQAGLIVMASIFCVIAIVSVAARFYARKLEKTYFGADDWLALVALFFVLGLNGIFLGGTIRGAITGHSPVKNNWPVSTNLEHLVEKFKYAFQITEKVTFGLIKISILLLWKRLFSSMRPFKIFCWIMIGFIIAWTISFSFATIFQCGTNWTWNWAPITLFLTQCTNTLNMLTVFCATDVFTDFIVMFMPVPLIWRLHMPMRKKLGVTSLFMVGLFTIAAGIARMYIYLTTSYDKEGNPDFIADFALFILWSEIEVNVAIIVCCMPTFLPVIEKIRSAVPSSISKLSLLSHANSFARQNHTRAKEGRNSNESHISEKAGVYRGPLNLMSVGVETTATQASDDENMFEEACDRSEGIFTQTKIVRTTEMNPV